MQARATVIIPTFGEARFARWAIRSVQRQTIKEIEICIICDGSPADMVYFFKSMAEDDPRIHVFSYPKSKRTGEQYRDEVIKQMSGQIVCYCCHDDLWLPNHVETVERTLKEFDFTHTIHAAINSPESIEASQNLFYCIHRIDLQDQEIIKKMQNMHSFFGLTFGAHTKESYNRLEEGWITTPGDLPTDLYMWNKFLSANGLTFKTTKKITALNFPLFDRKGWSEQKRDDELQKYFNMIQDDEFMTYAVEVIFKQYKRCANDNNLLIEQRDCYLSDVNKLDTQIEYLEQYNHRLESEVAAIYSTVSWRVTRPLRYIRTLFKH